MSAASRDTLIRFAFSGINPQTVDRLLAQDREPSISRRIDLAEDVRRALAVPSARREEELAGLGVTFLTRRDAEFPSWLSTIPGAPHWLFVLGRLQAEAGLAVVGSRRATGYGLDVARRVGSVIAPTAMTVVSGMAAGVDGAAHRGALEAGVHTVAVLGSGIDVWYPARHRGLARQILDAGGAMVSEYPPGATPEPWRFPLRNRIIAALSRAVVVVEAAERSGALITARLALDQNLDVFAIPGDIDRATSRGCNLLIRDGAHPLTTLEDLVEALGWVARPTATDGLFGGLTPGESIGVDALIERVGRGDPVGVLEELGRLEMSGAITVREGVVRVLPGTAAPEP